MNWNNFYDIIIIGCDDDDATQCTDIGMVFFRDIIDSNYDDNNNNDNKTKIISFIYWIGMNDNNNIEKQVL